MSQDAMQVVENLNLFCKKVVLLQEVEGEMAEKLVEKCPVNVFDIEDVGNGKVIFFLTGLFSRLLRSKKQMPPSKFFLSLFSLLPISIPKMKCVKHILENQLLMISLLHYP